MGPIANGTYGPASAHRFPTPRVPLRPIVLSPGTRTVREMSTEIIVRGAFSAFHPAERGTASATISYQGPEMDPVYRGVAQELEEVKRSAASLQESGAVTWWSAEQLRTWSDRPWNRDGLLLPLVHHARVGVEVKFRDFAALSAWVGQNIANLEGFDLERVKWALTASRRETLFAKAQVRAVQDATSRAQRYADALALGQVRPVSIADAGMLEADRRPTRESPAGASSSGGADVELVPNHIKLSAAVDARFVAERR